MVIQDDGEEGVADVYITLYNSSNEGACGTRYLQDSGGKLLKVLVNLKVSG